MLAFKNGPQVEIIGLAQFKKKADLNALGALKQGFVNASPSKSKTMAINTSETYLGFNILTDSIKMINANGHTMYIFPVALSSKRAVTFQNLTIDESANGTVAFVNTYTPTKKWIAEWKKGRPGKFDGDISVTYLNINNGSTNATSASNKNTKTTISDVRNPNTVANAPICTTTSYYYEIPYACASGQHYPGEGGCYLSGEDRAGYVYIDFDVTICVEDPNSGGGGGGTTPTPPGGYNPCPTDPPMISSKKSLRAKLMAISPTPCDSVVVDCAGVPGGNAYWIASCNTCVGGTTGKTGCPPTGEIKTDSLAKKFPCAKIFIIDKLNGVSGFTSLIAPFQGTGEAPNLHWDSSSTLPWSSGSSGTFQIGANQTNGWSSTIYINSSAIQNATPLIIATAAIHETAHAYANYLTKKNIYFPNQSGSWANDITYWSTVDSLYKAGQGNYIDHSNFLETYFERMVSILQDYDGSSSNVNDYRMAMLYGMNNPGDAPNPSSSSAAEINAHNKRAAKLSSTYNKLLTKYGLTATQINTFYNNNITNVPINKRLPTSCP